MNPGDWTNCVPENIKAFETVYNEGTKENVTGSYGLLDMTNTDSIKSYLVGGGVRVGSGSSQGAVFCVEFNPVDNALLGYENMQFVNSTQAFNCILDMRNKTFVVRKLVSNGPYIEIYFNNEWTRASEGLVFTLTNTNPSSLVFRYNAGTTIGTFSVCMCLEEVL